MCEKNAVSVSGLSKTSRLDPLTETVSYAAWKTRAPDPESTVVNKQYERTA